MYFGPASRKRSGKLEPRTKSLVGLAVSSHHIASSHSNLSSSAFSSKIKKSQNKYKRICHNGEQVILVAALNQLLDLLLVEFFFLAGSVLC